MQIFFFVFRIIFISLCILFVNVTGRFITPANFFLHRRASLRGFQKSESPLFLPLKDFQPIEVSKPKNILLQEIRYHPRVKVTYFVVVIQDLFAFLFSPVRVERITPFFKRFDILDWFAVRVRIYLKIQHPALLSRQAPCRSLSFVIHILRFPSLNKRSKCPKPSAQDVQRPSGRRSVDGSDRSDRSTQWVKWCSFWVAVLRCGNSATQGHIKI
mmetsp:Transcript_4677/g.9432  ORF Transcript_4677/g.9432 Transcript_4677/m.9432 type:complete len:214 (-) Transcript_4677:1026-1667(-)